MKTILFLTVGLGAFTLALGSAGELPRQPAKPGLYEHHPTGDRLAVPGSSRGYAAPKNFKLNEAVHRSSKSSPAGLTHAPTRHATTTEPRSPLAARKATVPVHALVPGEIENHREPLAGLTISRGSFASSPGLARGQGAVAAHLGGWAAPSVKGSAAAISGTGMKRKF